jgi:hypothetical protein
VSFLGVAGFGCRVQVQAAQLGRARDLLGDDADEQ